MPGDAAAAQPRGDALLVHNYIAPYDQRVFRHYIIWYLSSVTADGVEISAGTIRADLRTSSTMSERKKKKQVFDFLAVSVINARGETEDAVVQARLAFFL
mmetsp:Transcript_1962/g.7203  ORF Transcript_1962/g.7203 Transcript_1962/m.7203 type:complete len:100 (+) Transcript_1962:1149-1448(+)